MKYSAENIYRHYRIGSRGISLIEILVVVAIVAILGGLAGPSFISTTQRFRTLAEVNGFAGDLQYARTEAIKQGQPVTLCVSANGTSCSTTGTWEKGWIIFSDPDAGQTLCSACSKLRVQKPWSGTDTFASGTTLAITFNRDGFRALPAISAGTITFTANTIPANSNAKRCVTISVTGRQSTQEGAVCP